MDITQPIKPITKDFSLADFNDGKLYPYGYTLSMKITWCLSEAIAELTREHGGWQARVAGRPNDERSRVQCFVPAQSDGARHWTKSAPRFPATESPETIY